MLPIVEIPSNHVDALSGVSKTSGRAYNIRNQDAFLFNGAPYPEPFKLSLGDTQPPFEPGRYLIAQGSYERDRSNGNSMKMGRTWNLIPLAVAARELGELVSGKAPAARAVAA